jgi:formylglycine-generating enzyme required for sulfatase activity
MRVGPFLVEGMLGRGGMGVVYRAVDGAGRAVAVKVLPSDHFEDPRFVLRFKAEGETASKIRHENVTRCYGVGQEKGLYYIAFELVAGGSLQDRLKKGPLEWREAARLGAEIAGALEAIHEAGIVHRDLKPANVLVDEKGRAKLADFGLARAESMSRLTRTGELLGTLEYMAPELAEGGKAVDERADLYSLGATIYALVTGEPPFKGQGAALISAHLNTPPPSASEIVASVPAELDRIIHRLLSKTPGARGTASAAARELIALAESEAPAKGSRGLLLALVGVAVAIAIAIASFAARGKTPPPSPEPVAAVASGAPPVAAPEAAPLTKEALLARSPAWYRELPETARPRFPLRPGLKFGGPNEYVNEADGSVLVYVPSGEFLMGADSSEMGDDLDDAKPQHTVRLSAYFIGKYEVSNAQWKRHGVSPTKAEKDGGDLVGDARTSLSHDHTPGASWRTPRGDGVPCQDSQPVVQILWSEAVDYARNVGLRLPTEAEWERAAGWDGKTLHRYPWTSDEPPTAELANVRTMQGESIGRTHLEDVSSHPKGVSSVGAFNMCGNAAEFVLDYHDHFNYGTLVGKTVEDPCFFDAKRAHVVRGGSFEESGFGVAAYYRAHKNPDECTNTIGFRLALSEDGSPRPR